MEGHLNELGNVEGEGEQGDWDDVNQQSPVDFDSVELWLNELSLLPMRFIASCLMLVIGWEITLL